MEGARTLQGNSAEWRYVAVRRTAIFLDQSIRAGLKSLLFSTNDAATWATAQLMVSNLLQSLWSQGAFQGTSADAAFDVDCGLGSTMTASDVAEGLLILQVRVSLQRPGEFTTLTFKQRMQGS